MIRAHQLVCAGMFTLLCVYSGYDLYHKRQTAFDQLYYLLNQLKQKIIKCNSDDGLLSVSCTVP